MELVPIKIQHGEEKAWDLVCGLSRDDVCRRTGTQFDEKAEAYSIRCFGIDFHVNPCEMLIASQSERGTIFLGKLKDFFRLAVLWYMSNAKDVPATGRLIRPVDVKGGHRFSAGTHVLPVAVIAEKFARDREGFIKKGREYGAEVLTGFGDAYLRFYPLPRVPVSMILWLEDEEFTPRVDLFFDSTCELQLALSDIVWA
ncbi:MAG TPA: DUF3786 domain-containing protein, partial [Thermodesulfovibrionales bacterium]|nr:DUF3786 domain-containing protein [Thermodesulfovibrionales bacterium]